MLDTLPERIRSRIVQEPTTGCWLWTGACLSTGYGSTWWETQTVLVHRLLYELANGPVPAGLVVMHRCDVPACCNPAHLAAGTRLENQRDMVKKGRARGGGKPWAISREKLLEIYDLSANHSIVEVAARTGVGKHRVARLIRELIR